MYDFLSALNSNVTSVFNRSWDITPSLHIHTPPLSSTWNWKRTPGSRWTCFGIRVPCRTLDYPTINLKSAIECTDRMITMHTRPKRTNIVAIAGRFVLNAENVLLNRNPVHLQRPGTRHSSQSYSQLVTRYAIYRPSSRHNKSAMRNNCAYVIRVYGLSATSSSFICREKSHHVKLHSIITHRC